MTNGESFIRGWDVAPTRREKIDRRGSSFYACRLALPPMIPDALVVHSKCRAGINLPSISKRSEPWWAVPKPLLITADKVDHCGGVHALHFATTRISCLKVTLQAWNPGG